MQITKMRALRLQHGLSQKMMADVIGIKQSTLCRLEMGWFARVTDEVNEKLIRVFGEGFDTLTEIIEVDDPEVIIERMRNGGLAA
jgi:DNA-binding XRE family transcriptional regulator